MNSSIDLVLHIIAGSAAVFAGAVALLSQKGGRLHRRSGTIFAASMLIMAMFGAIISLRIEMTITVLAGLFTIYLVTSAWTTVKTPAGTLRQLDYYFPPAGALIGGYSLYCGYLAQQSLDGLYQDFPIAVYLFLAIPAITCALLDTRMVLYKGISGTHRIARHLWRMSFAMYLAIGSFIDQGLRSVIPESIQNTWITALPANLVLVFALWWLVSIFLTRKYQKVV